MLSKLFLCQFWEIFLSSFLVMPSISFICGERRDRELLNVLAKASWRGKGFLQANGAKVWKPSFLWRAPYSRPAPLKTGCSPLSLHPSPIQFWLSINHERYLGFRESTRNKSPSVLQPGVGGGREYCGRFKGTAWKQLESCAKKPHTQHTYRAAA